MSNFRLCATMPDGTQTIVSTLPIDFDIMTGATKIEMDLDVGRVTFSGSGMIAFNSIVEAQGGLSMAKTAVVGKMDDISIRQVEFDKDGKSSLKSLLRSVYPPATLQNIALGDS